ncbi:MAG TPA: Hsp70 family protein [Devosia sp.]|nr:Hsp70 family protein [Devosia sp.]
MSSPLRHCGLDFGTSNTTLAIARGNASPRLMALEDGKPTIPSVIFFDFDENRELFGRAAIADYIAGTDGRMMRSLKSILGSSLADERVRIKQRILSYLQIIGTFVAELKRRAEADIGEEFDSVVLGRPVHYVDDDPLADRKAQDQMESTVRDCGFRHIAFQFEPIAAALDYEQQVTREEIGLVVDLGGGTSDFSVVRVSPERARAADRQGDILSTAGVHVGGTDFDRHLSLRAVMGELGYQTPTADGKRPLPSAPYVDLATWHRINQLYDPAMLRQLRQTAREARDPERVENLIAIVAGRDGHRLAGAVEDAKVALTEAATVRLEFAGETVELHPAIARSQLENAIRRDLERIEDKLREVVAVAGLTASRIDTLILTGGSTRIPAILQRLRANFPDARFVETDAFASVGLGLALDARRRFG